MICHLLVFAEGASRRGHTAHVHKGRVSECRRTMSGSPLGWKVPMKGCQRPGEDAAAASSSAIVGFLKRLVELFDAVPADRLSCARDHDGYSVTEADSPPKGERKRRSGDGGQCPIGGVDSESRNSGIV
jgi:hypothetical protein